MDFPQITVPMIPLLSDADVTGIADDLDLLHYEGCRFFRVPLAESEDGQWFVNVDVGYRVYSESPCDEIKAIDFVMFGYEITAFDLIGGAMYRTMDPRQATCGIPDEIRHLVVDIASECYLELIRICDPEYIYRFTWIEEPSGNALKKHVKHTETLIQAGYAVLKAGTNKDGCKFWLLGKGDSDHSGLEQSELEKQLGVEP